MFLSKIEWNITFSLINDIEKGKKFLTKINGTSPLFLKYTKIKEYL